MWNLVSTTIAASIADSGMGYLTHQVRKRVGRWSNKQRVKDILACAEHVRFTPESGHVQCISPCPLWAKSGHHSTHSTTSLARASSDGGTVRPSALAVLRLSTSSYLVDACTGRSAGFSPLRMRST